MPAGTRTFAAALVLAPLVASACSLAFSLDGLTGGDAGYDATVDGEAIDGSSGDGAPDAQDLDAFAPEAGCTDSATATCLPVPQPGWQGPFILYDGDESSAPSCTPPTPNAILNAHADMNPVGDAQCSPACDCTLSATCASIFAWSAACFGAGSDCDGGAVTNDAGACISFSGAHDCNGQTWYGESILQSLGVDGSCVPTTQSVSLPPATWMRFALGCAAGALVQADCAHGQVCAPVGAAPFEVKACISRQGDLTCPGQPYSSKRLYYASVSDTRGCSPCTCGSPQGFSCPTRVAWYEYAGCTGTVSVTTAPSACNSSPSAMVTASGSPEGGACVSTGGGAPVGTATPSGPVTVCCLP